MELLTENTELTNCKVYYTWMIVRYFMILGWLYTRFVFIPSLQLNVTKTAVESIQAGSMNWTTFVIYIFQLYSQLSSIYRYIMLQKGSSWPWWYSSSILLYISFYLTIIWVKPFEFFIIDFDSDILHNYHFINKQGIFGIYYMYFYL